MRSSGLKGNAANHIDGPVENGLSHKEGEVVEVQRLAAKVVESVVQRASEEAEQRSSPSRQPPKRGCDLPRLPTIQIDTVPSPPWSPVELSPVDDQLEEPIDEDQIDLHLEEEEHTSESISEELRESLRSYVEEILSKAMVIAEKKLQFVGLEEEDEEEEEEEEEEEAATQVVEAAAVESEDVEKEAEVDEEEIRLAAEKVVEEVLAKATETVSEQLERDISGMEFPITFDEAPEDVKDAASNLIKEIVGKAITMAEEKAVPTVPFNFEDVDLMKTSGPWYVRVREALLRVLRSACFCTPRRSDS